MRGLVLRHLRQGRQTFTTQFIPLFAPWSRLLCQVTEETGPPWQFRRGRLKFELALARRHRRRVGVRHGWRGGPAAASVGGVHGVDVAVQLVPEGEPGLGGEVDLGAAAQAPAALPVAAPGRGGGEARLHLLYRNCRRGALPALAALLAAPVEWEALERLHTHDGGF